MFTGYWGNFTSQLQSMLYVAPVILLAIVCHEYAHGWMSDRLGDPTPRMSGRLTLNPFRHLDFMGTVCLLLFHVGWANPVPINPVYYKNRKKGIIYVSLAGPVANFILAYLSLLIEGLLVKFGSSSSVVIWVLYQLCYYSAVINIGLALFNLVPIPPLDGSKVAGEVSQWAREQYWRFQNYWRIILLLLVVTGVLSKPLGLLNDSIITVMWKHVTWILKLGMTGQAPI